VYEDFDKFSNIKKNSALEPYDAGDIDQILKMIEKYGTVPQLKTEIVQKITQINSNA